MAIDKADNGNTKQLPFSPEDKERMIAALTGYIATTDRQAQKAPPKVRDLYNEERNQATLLKQRIMAS